MLKRKAKRSLNRGERSSSCMQTTAEHRFEEIEKTGPFSQCCGFRLSLYSWWNPQYWLKAPVLSRLSMLHGSQVGVTPFSPNSWFFLLFHLSRFLLYVTWEARYQKCFSWNINSWSIYPHWWTVIFPQELWEQTDICMCGCMPPFSCLPWHPKWTTWHLLSAAQRSLLGSWSPSCHERRWRCLQQQQNVTCYLWNQYSQVLQINMFFLISQEKNCNMYSESNLGPLAL